jgi:putative transposase
MARLSIDRSNTDSEAWAEGRRRAQILSKLPERPGDAEVRNAISALGVSRSTLFRG